MLIKIKIGKKNIWFGKHKTDWIDDKVKEMKECMLSEKIPSPNEDCNFCTYSGSVNKFYK